MKNGEVRREENIQRVMCEGVCNKCREKLQWRFKYNKYKPLKNPSSCRDCNNKTIHKAYRALCDGCATKRKVCSSCSTDIVKANLEYTAHHKVVEEVVGNATVIKGGVSAADFEVTILGSNTTSNASSSSSSSGSSSESIAMDEDNAESASKRSKNSQDMEEGDTPSVRFEDGLKGPSAEKGDDKEERSMADSWDARKFNTIANLKYSKDRVVGSTEDGSGGASTVFSFNK